MFDFIILSVALDDFAMQIYFQKFLQKKLHCYIHIYVRLVYSF